MKRCNKYSKGEHMGTDFVGRHNIILSAIEEATFKLSIVSVIINFVALLPLSYQTHTHDVDSSRILLTPRLSADYTFA